MRRYRIGRADTNDIVLTDSTVSREHAELAELGEGRFAIKDLGSSYGIAIREGDQWAKVTEAELHHDTPLRIGDYETTVSDLVRDTDRTVVRPHAPRHSPTAEAAAPPPAAAPRPAEPDAQPTEATSPPAARRTHEPAAPSSPDLTAPLAPPRPAPPRPAPPRPAAPRPPTPRPAAPSRPPSIAQGAPVQPAAPAFQFLRNLPPERRPLVWLGIGFAAFLLIALITLILALAL